MDERREGAPELAELLDRAWTDHNLKGVATIRSAAVRSFSVLGVAPRAHVWRPRGLSSG